MVGFISAAYFFPGGCTQLSVPQVRISELLPGSSATCQSLSPRPQPSRVPLWDRGRPLHTDSLLSHALAGLPSHSPQRLSQREAVGTVAQPALPPTAPCAACLVCEMGAHEYMPQNRCDVN